MERIGKIFAEKHIEASVDEVFSLDDVNKALEKVATERSKGKNGNQNSLIISTNSGL